MKTKNINNNKVELPKITLAEIIVEKVYNRIDETVEKEKEVFAVEPPKPAPLKLELDLLYLMDTTGSMEEYVNATKVGLIDIMEKIIKCCRSFSYIYKLICMYELFLNSDLFHLRIIYPTFLFLL